MIKDQRNADSLAAVIRNAHTTGSTICITLPISPPVKDAETIYRYVHFKKHSDNKTVLAVVDGEWDKI